MKPNKTLALCALILSEAVILFLLLLSFLHAKRNPSEIPVPLEDMHSDYAECRDGSFAIAEGVLPAGNQVIFLQGPGMELKKGHYRANVRYRAGSDQSFGPWAVNAAEEKSAYLKSGIVLMGKNQTFVSSRFWVTEDIPNFEVRVLYDGNGSLAVDEITITADPSYLSARFLLLFLLFAGADLLVLFFPILRKHKETLLVLSGIVLLVSLPLFLPGFHKGHDTVFHLLRIDGIAEELRNGQFPVRMPSVWIDGYGFPVSIFYGELLLYFPALLRLFGVPLMASYKAYVLFVNIGTVLLSYFCFLRMKLGRNTAFLMTLAYSAAAYRLVNVYVRSALGESTAMMFMPLVILAFWRIYADPEESVHWKKNALCLALGMSGIVTCHVLSTEMTALCLLLLCLIFIRKTIQWNTLRTLLLAVLETLLLTAAFWVPFLDYYLNVDIRITHHEQTLAIQTAGAYPAQYFAFFQDAFGSGNVSTYQPGWRLAMTPGALLMCCLILALFLFALGFRDRKAALFTALSVLFLYIASDVFPWNFLAKHTLIGNVLSQVEFPWRYVGLAGVFLTLLAGILLHEAGCLPIPDRARTALPAAAMILGISYALFFLSNYCDGAEIVDYYDTAELDRYMISTGEYCRNGSHTHILDNQVHASDGIEAYVISRKGTGMTVHAEALEEGTVTLPVFNYKGCRLTDPAGQETAIMDGDNCQVSFMLPKGSSGDYTLRFVEPASWRLAELISLLSLLGLLILSVRSIRSSHRSSL
ncbi:MAG: hypothetical protein K6F35_00290 [Lachnospiraceae bacterium]|nr:hypothetical protein [Lachnospiraceae bacterium]